MIGGTHTLMNTPTAKPFDCSQCRAGPKQLAADRRNDAGRAIIVYIERTVLQLHRAFMKIFPFCLALAFCLGAVYMPLDMRALEPTQSGSSCGNIAVGSSIKPDLFAEVAVRLSKIPTKKDEFETSEAFTLRAQQALAQSYKQVVLPVEPVLDDELTAPGAVFEVGFSYDADTQKLVI